MGVISLMLISSHADDKTSSKDSKAKEPEAAVKKANPLSSFGRTVPAGVKNTGVWIPGFEKGKKTTLVEADAVTRVDDNRLMINGLVIHLYSQNPAENVQVDLSTATYHMTNEILRSATRSKVSRADFELEGDSMIFDTLTSQGRMIGNVRMTIHDPKAFMKPGDEESTTTPVDSKPTTPASAVSAPVPEVPANR